MAYSEAQIAKVLAQLAINNGNVAKTARETGITRYSIDKWSKDGVPGGDVKSVRRKTTQKKEGIADKLEILIHRAIDDAVNEKTLDFGTFQQRMTATGIAIDKMRLLRGQGDDAKRGMDDFLALTEFDDVEETEG